MLVGCQTTRQTRSAEPAGFLRDYSQLRPGEGDEAQLVYISPTASWSSYDAVMIDTATDVQLFVGRASAEAEITDTVTGERLAAFVDQRSGTKAIRGGIAKWSDVKLACEYWAEHLATRLAELGVKTRPE